MQTCVPRKAKARKEMFAALRDALRVSIPYMWVLLKFIILLSMFLEKCTGTLASFGYSWLKRVFSHGSGEHVLLMLGWYVRCLRSSIPGTSKKRKRQNDDEHMFLLVSLDLGSCS